jgi:hypothetical protein
MPACDLAAGCLAAAGTLVPAWPLQACPSRLEPNRPLFVCTAAAPGMPWRRWGPAPPAQPLHHHHTHPSPPPSATDTRPRANPPRRWWP